MTGDSERSDVGIQVNVIPSILFFCCGSYMLLYNWTLKYSLEETHRSAHIQYAVEKYMQKKNIESFK